MKVVRKIIQIDEELCDGCGQCVPSCAEGSLAMVDGKARVISDNLCDGLGACLGECPTGALTIIEREADEFDEEAVEKYLAEKGETAPAQQPFQAGGCPSAGVKMFAPAESVRKAQMTEAAETVDSALTHWPIQIRLVPPKAPFLKGADLLVLADCGAVAFPTLHRDLLKDRVVLMGCPKFDDTQSYIERFAAIFQEAGIRRITAVFMEVPCCSALPMILKKGMELSGVDIPMEEVVISVRGKILDPSAAGGSPFESVPRFSNQ